MDETERAALVGSIWESWLHGGVETVRDLIRLSVDATLAVDVDEVDPVQAMRSTIAEYVGDVSDAAKFTALVELVPGLHPSGAMVGVA